MKASERNSTDYLNDILDATESMSKVLDFKKLNHSILQNIQNIEAIECPDEYVGIVKISNKTARFVKSWIHSNCRNEVNEEQRRNFMSSNSKFLLIILESPHNDEFKNGTALGPALGETGKNLTTDFIELFNNSLKDTPNDLMLDGAYKVVLCNAIRYKTSLGYATKKYRDRIWINSWINGYRQDFKDRLNKYSPSIIVNLCTHGDHTQDELYTGKNKKQITVEFLKSVSARFEKFNISNNILYKCKTNNHKDCFPLREFVQMVIDDYISKNTQRTILKFTGNHPSSWSQNDRNKKIKWSA